MDATVSFNPDAYDGLKPVVKKAKCKVESMAVPDDDISVVHGDLFYPNILFDSDGQLKTVIDWEISGIYDCMYDVGFIESNILEIASLYDNTLSRDDILTEFRSKLGISQRQLRRVHLYKIWPHYTKLAAIDANDVGSDYYPDTVDPEEAVRDLFSSAVMDSNLDDSLTF